MTPSKLKNEIDKQRNSKHFQSPKNTSPKNIPKDMLISSKEPIDAFIDNLIEDKESIIQDANKAPPALLLFQREFEARDLPAINFLHFDGDSKQWPNFIQNFKHCVLNKVSFSDSVCMDCLLSVLDSKVKRAVSAIRQYELILCQCIKTFKTGIW